MSSIQRSKGFYYPSPEKLFCECIQQRAGKISNKGLLTRQQNITSSERISQILNASLGGTPTFIQNVNENGTRSGQPGGSPSPLRNKF